MNFSASIDRRREVRISVILRRPTDVLRTMQLSTAHHPGALGAIGLCESILTPQQGR